MSDALFGIAAGFVSFAVIVFAIRTILARASAPVRRPPPKQAQKPSATRRTTPQPPAETSAPPRTAAPLPGAPSLAIPAPGDPDALPEWAEIPPSVSSDASSATDDDLEEALSLWDDLDVGSLDVAETPPTGTAAELGFTLAPPDVLHPAEPSPTLTSWDDLPDFEAEISTPAEPPSAHMAWDERAEPEAEISTPAEPPPALSGWDEPVEPDMGQASQTTELPPAQMGWDDRAGAETTTPPPTDLADLPPARMAWDDRPDDALPPPKPRPSPAESRLRPRQRPAPVPPAQQQTPPPRATRCAPRH